MIQTLRLLINRNLAKNRREDLIRRLDILAHLQQQSGVPSYSSNALSRIATALVLSLGALGIFIQIIILLGIATLPILAIFTDIRSYLLSERGVPPFLSIIFSILISSYILDNINIDTIERQYILLLYPCQVISLFDKLHENGVLITGQIDDIQQENQITQIQYSYYLSDIDKTIRGHYLTKTVPSFVPGDTITIRYLDEIIHIPLFETGRDSV